VPRVCDRISAYARSVKFHDELHLDFICHYGLQSRTTCVHPHSRKKQ